MKIKDLFPRGRPVVSFEIFPPKRDLPIDSIYATIEELKSLQPDFISVTYGAGGSTKERTVEIASSIRNVYGIRALAHLTCVGTSKEEADSILKELLSCGISDVLALRGDPPAGMDIDSVPRHFRYAADLVAHIRRVYGDAFSIGGAAYPEGHVECDDIELGLLHLKAKVEMGVDFLITQLFFENEAFYRFLEKARGIGINVPISAGIMPVVNKKQIERIVTLCGASIPPKLARILSKYADAPEALEDAGVAYAVDQIVDLLSSGADGVHIYTMNRPGVARRIMESIARLLRELRKPKERAEVS